MIGPACTLAARHQRELQRPAAAVLPKSTDLRVYTPNDLMAAALQLNSRPWKTLDWDTPAQRLDMLINAKITAVLRRQLETAPHL